MKYYNLAIFIIYLVFSITITCKNHKQGSNTLKRQESAEEMPLKKVKSDSQDLTPLISNEVSSSTFTSEPNVEVATLVEYPLSSSTSITYYYPYFFKTHLITFSDDIDITVLSTSCHSPTCAFCDPINLSLCRKCSTGLFLYDSSCFSICPSGYITDVLRMKCVPEITVEVIYTKAYSIGSCKNSCGKKQVDCDCSASCKLKGDCCTDYDNVNCPVLIEKASKLTKEECSGKNLNCQYCDNDVLLDSGKKMYKCNQCMDSFYLHEGKCYENCPDETIVNNQNKLCVTKPQCNVNNCEECSNDIICKSCKKGFFKFENSCLEKCPSGYRADRITWTCLEPPVFAWYWVYPSRSSCKNYCGVIIQEDWDCSCSSDCFLYGNCCQDIEYYCSDLIFWRKNTKLRKSENLAVKSNIKNKKNISEKNIINANKEINNKSKGEKKISGGKDLDKKQNLKSDIKDNKKEIKLNMSSVTNKISENSKK